MKVRDMLDRKGSEVMVIGADESLLAAIRALNTRRIGALVVTTARGEVAGILSERDILRECARCGEADAGSESLAAVGRSRVRDVMTPDVITGSLDDDLTSVMNTMTEHRIRHLPILEGGALAGIISIGDAVKACVELAESENQLLKEYIQGGGY